METLPMPLDALSAQHGGLDEFRVSAPREVTAMLKQLCDGNVMLNLNAPDGSVAGATLWAIDHARGAISFSASANDPKIQALLDCEEAVAVGYLDNIKVQFDVHNLVLVRGANSCALSSSFPRELFRFQRRNAFRVRPLLRSAPLARLRHVDMADMEQVETAIGEHHGLPPPFLFGNQVGQHIKVFDLGLAVMMAAGHFVDDLHRCHR